MSVRVSGLDGESDLRTEAYPLLVSAREALHRRLARVAPALSGELVAWMNGRAGEGHAPEHYFTHPLAFPLLVLPSWVDESLSGPFDEAFHRDLMLSSMSGYYAIRLVDDVMDRAAGAAPNLLPATAILDTIFHSVYAKLFPATDPFWVEHEETWAVGHEAAAIEATLTDVDEATFERVSARKVWGALIPMRAIAWQKGSAVLAEPWRRAFSSLCRFHQRHNDLFDWKRDLEAGVPTLFLSEARRRARVGESVAGWVAREGFAREVACVDALLHDLERDAAACGSTSFVRWVASRRELWSQATSAIASDLVALSALLTVLEGPRP